MTFWKVLYCINSVLNGDSIEPVTLSPWQVFVRCTHLLASSDPRLRLSILDTIAECCKVLQNDQGTERYYYFCEKSCYGV